METKILMIDDDSFFLNAYEQVLKDEYKVLSVDNSTKGIKLIEQETPDLLLLDISMNTEHEGLSILPYLREKFPWLPVIMVTNLDKHTLAKQAQQHGAIDYFVKSSDLSELKILIRSVLNKYEQKALLPDGIVAESPLMKKVFTDARRAARFDMPVLISGASGTGKEVLARYIHQNSNASDKPFVAINCGALTDTIMESELFGHEKGAFTGAVDKKQGKIQLAQGGTLFLDEMEDLSLRGQVTLLRALQEKEIQPIGSNKKIAVDFRLITAVNTDLKKLVEKGGFREDLYYRIAAYVISIPALRKRQEDILPLALHFMQNFCERNKIKDKNFSQSALRMLKAYDWPGNVRELKNAVERAVLNSRTKDIRAVDFQLGSSMAHSVPYEFARNNAIREFKEEYIKQALVSNHGNISATAKEIGISRTALQKILKEFKLNSSD